MYLRGKTFFNPTNVHPQSTTGFNYYMERKAFSHKAALFPCLAVSWVSHDKDKLVRCFWLFFFSSSSPGTARPHAVWVSYVGVSLLVSAFTSSVDRRASQCPAWPVDLMGSTAWLSGWLHCAQVPLRSRICEEGQHSKEEHGEMVEDLRAPA